MAAVIRGGDQAVKFQMTRLELTRNTQPLVASKGVADRREIGSLWRKLELERGPAMKAYLMIVSCSPLFGDISSLAN